MRRTTRQMEWLVWSVLKSPGLWMSLLGTALPLWIAIVYRDEARIAIPLVLCVIFPFLVIGLWSNYCYRQLAEARAQQLSDERRKAVSRLDRIVLQSEQQVANHHVETCAICMVEYRQGDVVVCSKSPVCRHVFHEQCLGQWFKRGSAESCPVCRHRFGERESPHENDSMVREHSR